MWCVCSDRQGNLSLITREAREDMLKIFMDAKKKIATHVVKEFDNKNQAKKYISDIKTVNKIIDKI